MSKCNLQEDKEINPEDEDRCSSFNIMQTKKPET